MNRIFLSVFVVYLSLLFLQSCGCGPPSYSTMQSLPDPGYKLTAGRFWLLKGHKRAFDVRMGTDTGPVDSLLLEVTSSEPSVLKVTSISSNRFEVEAIQLGKAEVHFRTEFHSPETKSDVRKFVISKALKKSEIVGIWEHQKLEHAFSGEEVKIPAKWVFGLYTDGTIKSALVSESSKNVDVRIGKWELKGTHLHIKDHGSPKMNPKNYSAQIRMEGDKLKLYGAFLYYYRIGTFVRVRDADLKKAFP